MNRIATAALAAALTLALPMQDAEAKRLSSGGIKRSTPTQPAQTPPAQQAAPQSPAQSPTAAPAQAGAAAAAAAPAKRSWLGPVAGLAAGLGLAALASHLGFGEGLANFMMILLLGVALFFIVRLVMRRFAPQRPQLAGAGAGGNANFRMAEPAPQYVAPQTSAAVAAVPASFDSEGFAKIAKQVFIRMQAANDAGDQADLRRFTTPEMYAHIQQELLERANKTQRTDVLELNAQVVEVASEHGEQIVSVRFSGLVREESEAAATSFDEVWHLVRAEGQEAWAIAGIQATA